MEHEVNCADVISFLENISKYNHVAFQTKATSVCYPDFCNTVYNTAKWLINDIENNYVEVSFENPYYFSIGFFAVLLSGKSVFLGKISEKNFDYYKLSENDIKKCYSYKTAYLLEDFNVSSTGNILVCSSGTSSNKKIVVLSQNNVFCDTISGMKNYSYPLGWRYLNVIPCTHMFGLVADILGPLYSGGTICVLDNKYEFFRLLSYFHPHSLNLPPIMVEKLLELLEDKECKHKIVGNNLRKIMCAGAKLSENTIKTMLEYGIEVYTAYGLTECSPCVSLSCDNEFKFGSAGKILDCCQVKILDGEILVKGKNVMVGYFNNDKLTNEVLVDGWLHTGDLGYIDFENYLYVTGRKDALLVFANGYKIAPEPIEAQINSLQGVIESEIFVETSSCEDKISANMNISSEANKEIISSRVKSIVFEQTGFLMKNIFFMDSPLEKTELGKIKRCRV